MTVARAKLNPTVCLCISLHDTFLTRAYSRSPLPIVHYWSHTLQHGSEAGDEAGDESGEEAGGEAGEVTEGRFEKWFSWKDGYCERNGGMRQQ